MGLPGKNQARSETGGVDHRKSVRRILLESTARGSNSLTFKSDKRAKKKREIRKGTLSHTTAYLPSIGPNGWSWWQRNEESKTRIQNRSNSLLVL